MSDTKIKLLKKIIIKGTTEALTGLHIGGTNSSMDIGGVDNVVIRNPVNSQPYVPGSSLKGKMRSLLEMASAAYDKVNMGKVKNGPGSDPTQITTQLFGSSRGDEAQRPSRIIVRDGRLLNPDLLRATQFSETKTEVVIDRITAAAMPRQLERVPAGAVFSMEIVLNVFDEDKEEALMKTVFQGLSMVQDDYLGGSGSRGSGQVKFSIDTIQEKSFSAYLEGGAQTQTLYDKDQLVGRVPSELLT